MGDYIQKQFESRRGEINRKAAEAQDKALAIYVKQTSEIDTEHLLDMRKAIAERRNSRVERGES